MEFKKHFSNNLHNLSVKKTFVMQPPPQLESELSLSSQLMSSKGSNSPFQKHRHTSSAINDFKSSQQQNCYLPLSNRVECRSNSQQKLRERQLQGSPILTFQAIKQGFLEKEYLSNRKVFLPCGNHLSPKNEQPRLGLKQSNSLAHLGNKRTPQITNNVRLGSMVFSSLSKKKDNVLERAEYRDSKSQEKCNNRLAPVIECMNNDGHPAKYKVAEINSGENEEMLHYCFNCAIPLVKQGFSIQELSFADKQKLGFNKQNRNVLNVNMRASSSSKDDQQQRRMKKYQHLKSKVILKINKVKACREDFEGSFNSATETINSYYDSLIDFLEDQRKQEHHELNKTKNKTKIKPQRYEQQLNSSLGTLDYLSKHPEGVNPTCLQDIEELLQNEVCYPRTQLHLSSQQNLEQKIEHFKELHKEGFMINYCEMGEESFYQPRRYTVGESSRRSLKSQESDSRGTSQRFSFQSALQNSKANRCRRTLNSYYEMNPLQQQNQSELQDSFQDLEQRRDAFRNLFPEENEENDFSTALERATQSPNFKEF